MMAKNRITRAFLCALLLTLPTMLIAAPVSWQQAQAVAAAFMQQKGMETAKPAMVFRAPRQQKPANSYYYVFNSNAGKGFVIVSGDDRTPRILGYSDSGTFDNDALPQNIKAFLQNYADEIRHLDDANVTTVQKVPVLRASATTHSVSPLLKSKWNQSAPYYNNTPDWNTHKTVTGCVATAMAQVMYYYKWPAKTTAAIPSYSYTVNGIETTVDGQDADAVIDWDNMVDKYTGSETDEQNTAVANLMLYAGKAVKMQYLPSNYGGSQAFNTSIEPALKNYFDYSSKLISRTDFSLSEFEQTIYNEVANDRPVIFCGTSTGGGHCFVIDGYDGSGLFHVNWGWGGMSDGYFLLSVLNPENNSGIGASATSDGYSILQCAIVGIAKGATTELDVSKQCLTPRNITIDNDSHQLSAAIYNLTDKQNSFDYALAVIKDDGTVGDLIGTEQTTSALASGEGISVKFSYADTKLEAGTYRLAIVSRVKGTTDWKYFETGMLLLTIDDEGNATMKKGAANLSTTAWDFTGTKSAGTAQPVSITINNSGEEYYGTVFLFASTTKTKGSAQSTTGLTAKANGTTTVEMSFTPDSARTYNVWLCSDITGSNVIGETTVEIAESGTNVVNLSGSFNPSNGATVYGKELKGTYTLKNSTETAYNGNITVVLFVPSTGNQWTSSDRTTERVSVPANSSASYSFNFNVSPGNYLLGLYMPDGSSPFAQTQLTSANGITVYDVNGTSTGVAPTTTYAVPATATAVDFSGVESTVTTINTDKANPNALYYFSASSDAATTLAEDNKNVIINGSAENLTLTDGHDFYAPETFTATTATFTRTPKIGADGTNGWQTICLPFEASSITADGEAKHWFTAADDKGKDLWVMEFAALNGSSVVFGYNSGSTLAANIPYIIAVPGDHWGAEYSLVDKELTFSGNNVSVNATAEVPAISNSTAYSFVGTMAQSNVTNAYTLNSDGNAFNLAATATASPFTAYFTAQASGSLPQSLSIGIEGQETTPTGIDTIKAEAETENNTPKYSLTGQRVGNSYKGVVIQNGKKIINK